MPTNRFACIHHFHHVVTSSDGHPTCRGCGRRPTPAEEAAGIESLLRWEQARNKAVSRRQRN